MDRTAIFKLLLLRFWSVGFPETENWCLKSEDKSSKKKKSHKVQSMRESCFSRYFHRSHSEGLVLEHFSFMAMAQISSAYTARSKIIYTNAFFKDSDICFFTSPHCLGWCTFMVSNLSPFLCSAFKVIFLSFHMYYWGPCFSAYHDQHIKATWTGVEPPNKLHFSHQ